MFENLHEKMRGSFSLGAGIHMDGNRELIIENCSRIEEYDEVFMQLISGRLRVQIWGNSLRAFDFKTHGVVIRGKISRIELVERSTADEKSAQGKC